MLINLQLVREKGIDNEQPQTPSFNNRRHINSHCIYCQKHQQNVKQLLETVQKLLDWKNAANLLIERREDEIKKTMELLRESEERNNQLLKIVDGKIAQMEIIKEQMDKMNKFTNNRLPMSLKSRQMELMKKIEKLQSQMKSKQHNRMHHRRAMSYTQPSQTVIPVTHTHQNPFNCLQNPESRVQHCKKSLASLKQQTISLKL